MKSETTQIKHLYQMNARAMYVRKKMGLRKRDVRMIAVESVTILDRAARSREYLVIEWAAAARRVQVGARIHFLGLCIVPMIN